MKFYKKTVFDNICPDLVSDKEPLDMQSKALPYELSSTWLQFIWVFTTVMWILSYFINANQNEHGSRKAKVTCCMCQYNLFFWLTLSSLLGSNTSRRFRGAYTTKRLHKTEIMQRFSSFFCMTLFKNISKHNPKFQGKFQFRRKIIINKK